MSTKKRLAFVRVIDKILLPEQYDRRKKLTTKQKQEIRRLYNDKTKNYTYRSLADMYGVAFGTIQCTINEETRKKNLIIAQNYRNGPNYKKAKQTMNLRYRKKALIKKGIIKINN